MGPLCSVQGLQPNKPVTGSPNRWKGEEEGRRLVHAMTAGPAAKQTRYWPVQSRVESRYSFCRGRQALLYTPV